MNLPHSSGRRDEHSTVMVVVRLVVRLVVHLVVRLVAHLVVLAYFPRISQLLQKSCPSTGSVDHEVVVAVAT